MKILQEIESAWAQADGKLQIQQNEATRRGTARKEQKIRALRVLNDRAYFLLLFAHFEDSLNSRVRSATQRRQASAIWSTRRGWDMIDISPGGLRRIPFRSRLALCTDRSATDWQTISDYYGIRNDLAHVGSTQAPFIIPIVRANPERIATSLHR